MAWNWWRNSSRRPGPAGGRVADISELIVGLECGGSDPTSGFSINVVLGNTSDRLVDLGGTTILCETPEAIGAENILKRRGLYPPGGAAAL